MNYWTGEVTDGPAMVREIVAKDGITVFARAGAIVPMLDASVDTLWPTDAPDVVDHEDVADILWIDVWPRGDSSFALADGTAIGLAESGGAFSLSIDGAPACAHLLGSARSRPTYDGARPSDVTGAAGALTERADYDAWAASESGWFFNDATGELWIRDGFDAGTLAVR